MADIQASRCRLMEILNEQYQRSPAFQPERPILENDLLRDELGFDSLALVVLQIEIEDAFGIRFDPAEEDLQQVFFSVGTLFKSVQDHLQART